MIYKVPSPQEFAMQPAITSDPTTALRHLEESGAVIMGDVGPDERDARAAATALFGKRIQALPEAARVFDGGEGDVKLNDGDHTQPMLAHTDGFGYGDCFPDYIALSCVNASPIGGESFLVDGYAVLQNLLSDSSTSEAAKRLATTVVDLTEDGMQPAISPIIVDNGHGRTMVRRTLVAKPTDNSRDQAADRAMIQLWEDAIEAATEDAERFRLAPGQALFIDNYRCMHGREGYNDPGRLLWRVWIWTDSALGVPAGKLHSDTRYARVAT